MNYKGMSKEELEAFVAILRQSIKDRRDELEKDSYDLSRALDYLYTLDPNPKGGRH